MAEIHRQCSSNEQHVAVLAFPFGTHAAPLLALTRRLADAASDVTFSFFTTAKSNSSIFGSKPHGRSNLKSYDVEDGLPEGYQFKGPEEAIQLFLKASPGNFNKGLEVAVSETKKSISCIMSDSFLWFAADMADELGVPWLPLWTAGAFSLSAHFYTDLIRSTVAVGPNGIAGREDETLDFIPGMSAARIRDLPEGILTGNLESGFSVMLHWMGRMLPRAAAVTINSFQELNPATTDDLKSKFKQCLSVGPITQLAPQTHEPDQTGCLSWLDLQKPCSVVFVSFGTVIALPPDELAALAKGLEASGAPFIWSLKERLTGQLPEGFLDATRGRGMVVPWAPQSQVLEHPAIGAFVTHGGWNSVLESITGGVPMICRPFFGDQRQNGRMVSDVWGIGVMIEGGVLTKDGVVKAVDLILGKGEEGRKTREKVWLLKEMAEKAVGPNGSSSKNLDFLVHIIREAGK